MTSGPSGWERPRLQSRALIAGVLPGSFSVGVFAGAAAATTYSDWRNFGGGYHVRGYTTSSGGVPIGGAHVERTNGASSAAGYLGAAALLSKGTSGCAVSNTVYNSRAIVRLVKYIQYDCGAGNYRTQGLGRAYQATTGAYADAGSNLSPYYYVP